MWSSGGQVRVAAFGLAVPPELIVPRLSRPRGIPSFPELLRDLVPPRARHREGGRGRASLRPQLPSGALRGTPRRPSPSECSPGWDVSEMGKVLRLAGPEGTA